MIMVAGVLLTATGFTLIIEHPAAQPPPAWIAAIAGGLALFLAGRSAFEYVIYGRLTWPRPIGIILLAVVAVTVVHLPPTISSAAATLVLAGRRVRHSPRSSAPTRTTVTSYLEVIGGAN
jgi:low temperature requirement protein LtrA